MPAATAASASHKPALQDAAVGVGVAGATFAATHAAGAYGVGAWGPLGLGLVAAAVLQLAAGLRPARRVVWAASALVALAAWAALSALRAGVTGEALSYADRLLLAAAALLVGAMLTGEKARQGRAAAAGVAAAATVVAAEVLTVLPINPHHNGWIVQGILVGPAGYKNAQGALFATSLPLVVWLAQSGYRTVRGGAAASGVLLVAALLLTQSRGALAALTLALLVQMLIDRRPGIRRAVIGLYVAGAILFGVFAHINGSLAGGGRHGLTQYAVGAFALACVAAAAAGRADPARARSRTLLTALVALLFVATVTAGALESLHLASSGGAAAPRVTDLSLRGRAAAWSAAWQLSRREPLLGNGVGSFARQWPLLRPPNEGHILQPHSIELEQLAELGVVGLLLFAGSWWLLFRCPDNADPPLAAAATGTAVVLLAQASVDWTMSFAGVVAPVCLVIGVAGGGRRGRPPRLRTELAVAAAGVAALGILAAPYLAHRAVAAASSDRATNPTRALARARSATRLDPWSESAYALQGSILEAGGDYVPAARAYASAAALALEPWVDHLDEARAAAKGGRKQLARSGCNAALLENPYAVAAVLALCPEPDGRPWPLSTLKGRSPGAPYSRLLVSEGCDECRVARSGDSITARVPGGFPFEDTALAVASPAVSRGKRGLHVALRVSLRRAPTAPLVFAEVRDARQRLIFSLFVAARSRELYVYNPPHGFHVDSFVAPLEARVPETAPGVRITVTLLRDSLAEFKVEGRRGFRMPSPGRPTPDGTGTGPARFVETGIGAYGSNALEDPVEVTISGLVARRGGT